MFQTSSEGDNPEAEVRQNTRGKGEFGSIFCLAANLTLDVPASHFTFFKAGLSRTLFKDL